MERVEGGAVSIHLSKLSIKGHNVFDSNEASLGGVLFIYNSTIILGDNNTFKNNVAHRRGGSVYAENSIITLIGYNTFSNEDSTIFAFSGGGGLAAINCTLIVKNETSLLNNAAYFGGAIYMIIIVIVS